MTFDASSVPVSWKHLLMMPDVESRRRAHYCARNFGRPVMKKENSWCLESVAVFLACALDSKIRNSVRVSFSIPKLFLSGMEESIAQVEEATEESEERKIGNHALTSGRTPRFSGGQGDRGGRNEGRGSHGRVNR